MVEMGCTNWEAGLTSRDISVSPSIVMPRRSIVMPRHELLSVPQASKISIQPQPYLKAGLLLATPTSFWQHRIEPPFAFPQQLLQMTKMFSSRPPTFLSMKTNELTNAV